MKDRKNIIIAICGVLFLSGIAIFFQKKEKESFLDSLASSENFEEMERVEESEEDLEEYEKKAYITGEVEKPGVYSFLPGERLENLVEKAGGFTAEAEPESVNLALLLEDEMMIKIPRIGEFIVNEEFNKEEFSKINLNSASKEELMTLPGIGEKKAEAIINFREELPFKNIDEIMNVPGIGPSIFSNIEEQIEAK